MSKTGSIFRLLLILVIASFACSGARADVINFNDISSFPSAHGPVPDGALPDGYGSNALVTISYASSADFMYPAHDYVFWWQTYGDLNSVIYSANPWGSMLISFTPAPGYQITLNGFDLGQDLDSSSGVLALDVTPFRINDTAGPGYMFPLGSKTLADVHTHFDANYSSTGTITLVVGSNWDIGIDNIDYTVAPVGSVPEPSSFALLAVGLAVAIRRVRSR